jgi:hypothetical protein
VVIFLFRSDIIFLSHFILTMVLPIIKILTVIIVHYIYILYSSHFLMIALFFVNGIVIIVLIMNYMLLYIINKEFNLIIPLHWVNVKWIAEFVILQFSFVFTKHFSVYINSISISVLIFSVFFTSCEPVS